MFLLLGLQMPGNVWNVLSPVATVSDAPGVRDGGDLPVEKGSGCRMQISVSSKASPNNMLSADTSEFVIYRPLADEASSSSALKH